MTEILCSKFDLYPRGMFARLLAHVRQYADLDRKFHISYPLALPAQSQRGENCKLKALADAMQHAASKAKCSYFPFYKSKIYPISLRELAKRNASVVGEVYSLEMLLKTCNDAGFEANTYAPATPDEYIVQLEQLIDENYVPIVFFDLDTGFGPHRGYPYIGDGKNEHAAVVVGYYRNEFDKTYFIISQWDKYFVFDGMELALSSYHSLSDRREVETFRKVRNYFGITFWTLSSKPVMPDEEIIESTPQRTAHPMKDGDTPLKGKIMVVTTPNPRFLSNPREFISEKLSMRSAGQDQPSSLEPLVLSQ